MRHALLDFIADFANWDNSNNREYLATSRVLTQTAYEVLGGTPESRPLVVDPFAGGGSIPVEALRVGADVFASDLNPVAMLLNKCVLQSIPKYGERLAKEVRKRGQQIQDKAAIELANYYPRDSDGKTPVVYLWARTIRCEGPGCGSEIPLIRSLWLSKKFGRPTALHLVPDRRGKRVDLQIIVKRRDGWVDQNNPKIKFKNPSFVGTVRRSSTTCPCCGYTTSAENTRKQFLSRAGGANDARLIAVVLQQSGSSGVYFRLGNNQDMRTFKAAVERCTKKEKSRSGPLSLVPDEPLPYLRSIFNIYLLGVDTWGKLFNGRQALALVTLVEKTRSVVQEIAKGGDREFSEAAALCLSFAIDRCADYWSSLAVWSGEFVAHTFGRQALGIIWDYAEANGFAGTSGTYAGAIEWICRVIENLEIDPVSSATVDCVTACHHPLPNDSAQAFITDPPYYDAVPYADLADFFYVWLKRSIGDLYPTLFRNVGTPKDGEIVQLSERNPIYAKKTREYFEALMKEAMKEGRRVLEPHGIGIVVFAHKTTTGWETQIQAMIDAGWMVTASWPIDTERPGRLRANNSAALASSVHLVCRPRENQDGSVRADEIGDWRDVLLELPRRIHEWMPRLVDEGIVGADAIFACIGPALEVFSRYSRVEKASGETVTLKEYLEHVWATVAKEALAKIFVGADTVGFEEDARLTAMWLWTLSTAASPGTDTDAGESEDEESAEDDDENNAAAKAKARGFVLEYDAARKIAQGLGAHLDQLTSLIEVKGETARLLPVAERTRSLFQKGDTVTPISRSKAKRKSGQLSLGFVADLEEAEAGSSWGDTGVPHKGETVLDRVHQSMILFGAGRGEALKRFLVDDGAGRDSRFWHLAQAFSALYPASTDEKRWVDGVLARKKSFGF